MSEEMGEKRASVAFFSDGKLRFGAFALFEAAWLPRCYLHTAAQATPRVGSYRAHFVVGVTGVPEIALMYCRSSSTMILFWIRLGSTM